MMHQGTHGSDQELVQALDGELSRSRSVEVRAHCESCWRCRGRMAELESTIIDFAALHRQTFETQIPPIPGPRALLKARIEASAELAEQSSWSQLPRRVISLAACATLLAALVGSAVAWNISRTKAQEQGSSPDHTLTPGMTRPVSLSDICSMPHEEVVRDVPDSLRQRVLAEYHLKDTDGDNYEIDYLITPGLGGADDIRNLWPEPLKAHRWNAHVKDTLEEQLHHLVCTRQIGLETAQREIATDWIGAYKKYFHTDRPIAPSSRLSARNVTKLAEITTSALSNDPALEAIP
jgi:hypothetical protein